MAAARLPIETGFNMRASDLLHSRRRPANGARLACAAVLAISCIATATVDASAQSGATGPSGLPLPRFVSLKAGKVNMRVGPGTDYQVEWMFTRRGLPLEILQEFDTWRKVRDSEGSEGWIQQALLSGSRTAIVRPWARGEANSLASLHKEPAGKGEVVALIEPGVIAGVDQCAGGWCRVEAGGTSGYLKQQDLWGVYPDETID